MQQWNLICSSLLETYKLSFFEVPTKARTTMTTKDVRHTTAIEDLELEAAGYKREMPRRFNLFSLMSLSFALSCTWSGTGSSIGISLTEASSAGTIWAIPIAGAMTAIVTLGMAELSSAYPVAGAQYYWSFMVSNKRHRAFAAYL